MPQYNVEAQEANGLGFNAVIHCAEVHEIQDSLRRSHPGCKVCTVNGQQYEDLVKKEPAITADSFDENDFEGETD